MEINDVDAGAGMAPMDVEEEVQAEPIPPEQPHEKFQRRGSMTEEEERLRRHEIKSILQDKSIDDVERRRSIQYLMDGRRNSMGGASSRRTSGTGASVHDEYGNPLGNNYSNHSSDGGYPGQQILPGVPMGQNLMVAEADSGAGMSQLSGPPAVCIPVPSLPNGTSSLMLPDNTNSGNFNQICHATEQSKRAELTRPPCQHYERKCTIIAPCCGAAFGCRICHDDCPVLPPKIEVVEAQNLGRRKYPRSSSLPSSFTSMDTPEETHHNIDRFAIREVICRVCYTRQSSQTNNCIQCNTQFGEYHCSTCNLWMSMEERPYHCEHCGFCRVGGAENFLHCHDCGMCIDKSLYTNHNCKVGKYKSNCPVCQEYLFSSRSASHEMPCGHAIHWDCFRQLAAHDSRCPVCKKTAETTERMMPTWNAMAAGVSLQPVPPELARVVNITCNDCEKQDDARAWHFLGVQCRNCSSFNTVVDRIVLTGEEAHDFLEALALRNPNRENSNNDSGNGSGQQSRRRYHRRRSNHT